MSCLNLGKRLLPARKAWRSFTSKLQTKLHKLHNSKPIKKKKTQHQKKSFNKTTKYRISSAAVLRPRLQNKKPVNQRLHSVSVQYRRSHAVQKRAAPVYVDELFNEAISKEVEVRRLHAPVMAGGASAKRMKVVEQAGVAAGSGGEGGKCCGGGGDQKTTSGADEMWESVGLASPLMYGIDERAEEFIARFKAGLARGV